MALASNPRAWGMTFVVVVGLAVLWATDVGRTTQADTVK